jgi:hypothetical protein
MGFGLEMDETMRCNLLKKEILFKLARFKGTLPNDRGAWIKDPEGVLPKSG